MPRQLQGTTTTMTARPGDRLVVRSQHVGEPDRDAEIIEVRGASGTPPYLVRWESDGHTGLVFPGPDSYVQHLGDGHRASTKRR